MLTTLNLGILAHVDAGKTSLTERLLHHAGIIDEIGSVDAGSTQTDSMALERRRGITIKSAVVSFAIDDVAVNLIDTPGHPDFIAEVERVLGVLDGAVLVISAVEGVQPQTRVLMRVLQRLRIPTVIFVNKIDRRGAQGAELLDTIEARLSTRVIAPSITDSAIWTEKLAEHDDELLAAFVEGTVLPPERLRQALADQTKRALVHPVYFGSATAGIGIEPLVAAVKDFLPPSSGMPEAPPTGTVFKVERGTAGEKIAYLRMFDGTVHVRERLPFGKVTGLEVFGRDAPHDAVRAGQIAKVRGLSTVRIGDSFGPVAGERHYFSPPTLETVVLPQDAYARAHLYAALTELAEQDPLINVRQEETGEASISLYGEVQKEVIEATLAEEYGIAVAFRETTTICVERPNRTARAAEMIKDDGNPFIAGVGLRIDPAPIGSGAQYRLEIEPGTLLLAFRKAVEETVLETLQQGLHGWQVTDCVVALTASAYWPRQSRMHGKFDKSMSSTAGDFRHLTRLVLMSALAEAGTTVCEPVQRFRLEVPPDAVRQLLPVLTDLRSITQSTAPQGNSTVVEGQIPAVSLHTLEKLLPGLTGGEGVLETRFGHYQPILGPPPRRAWVGLDPRNRKEYLQRINRRVAVS